MIFTYKTLFKTPLTHSWQFVFFAVFLSLVLNLSSSKTLAQVPESPKPSDVRIVIDISGSMKKNDPQNLRRPALEMLVKLLPEGSKAGVWTFGQYVNMLVKHREVDKAWKQEAAAKAKEINSIAQFTNIGLALEKSSYDKTFSSKDAYQTHVILLTDGMVDIDRNPAINDKERQRILGDILPDYQKAEFHLHTVSLSNKADMQLMDRLALETDGRSVVAKSADELMKVFLEVFDQAVPKEEVPFDNNSFATDSSIEEFTALIFRKPNSPETTLLSPDNTEYTKDSKDDSINWYRSDKYDLITVKQPLEGEWRVLADLEPQSRITVVSDLSLVVKSLPSNIMQNEKIDLSLALREENKVIDRAEFLDLLDIDLSVSNAVNKESWTTRLSEGLVPGNGVYKTQIDKFNATGQYDITVTVDGKTFKRRFTHNITVREPFAVSTSSEEKGGKAVYKVTVIPQDSKINIDKTEVVGKLKDPTGSSSIVKFVYTKNKQWELSINPEKEGTYYLTLRITQESDKGKVDDIVPKPISFSYPFVDNEFQSLFESEPEPVQVKPAIEESSAEVEAEAEPEVEEGYAELSSEELMDEPESEGISQWIMYGVLAVVNILIILVIYLLYRKLFGRKKLAEDDDIDAAETASAPAPEATSSAEPEAPPAFEEPPMDEMMIDDLDDDIDSSDVNPEDNELDLSSESVTDSELDLDTNKVPDKVDPSELSMDEEPEFSLDDFAPDELDEDEADSEKEK